VFLTSHASPGPREAYAAARGLPAKAWKATREQLRVDGPLELRDASLPGGQGSALKVAVAAGEYAIARASVDANGLSLSLVKLTRRD
jgi:hypothetical protein